MSLTLITNIGTLAGARREAPERLLGSDMDTVPLLRDAWLLIDGELIADYGPMTALPAADASTVIIDAEGGWVLPAWCDPHTHIVYAGSREGEFRDKIAGLTYEEIGRRGGGILNSAALLRATPADELMRQSMPRLREVMAKGTGAIEIKSGYGLTTESELKMLSVIAAMAAEVPAIVKATFLGAHAVPAGMSQERYVDVVCTEMIPAVAAQGVAQYVDVFCDRGYFTPEQTMRIARVGLAAGLTPKLHANELAASGGVEVGVAVGALSVDHLENAGADQIRVLAGTSTMPTALPGASFFSSLPYAPAADMIRAGLGVALASDYNPGSSPSGDMRFVCSLACLKMGLTPEQAFNAATVNAAYAMGCSREAGTITPGKRANLQITAPMPQLAFLFYAYTTPLLRRVIIAGHQI